MAGRECYHCKQWVEQGEAHDCWTTTEAALTRDLSDDLRDAWERLRETATTFGEQRVYASHHSIMFSRRTCYFFVRPKRTCLEVCVFLGRTLRAPQVRRAEPASRSKIAHIIRITHRDQVEPPLTDWLLEAYALAGQARGSRSDTTVTAEVVSKAVSTERPASARRGAAKARRTVPVAPGARNQR